MEKVDYLIIGNGIASLATAKEIRNNDDKGRIVMVSSEPHLTYYRLKLTEYLAKDFEDEELIIHNKDWYRKNNIEVLLSKIVEKVDIENNKIRLDDSTEMSYEKLLIATGSKPFIPPVSGKYKQGVLALRTLDDLKYIKNYFSQCEDIAVIGGGLLGLEAAWSLKKLGKKVTIIEFAPYLLPRQLDEDMGNKLEKKLIEEGFNVYLSSSAEEIIGENKVNGIKLNNGEEIKTDGILFSVGIRPNLDIVRDTPIKLDKGIIVDSNLKTNIDNVYAAGDVVEVNGMVIGLWTSGNEQGKIAGANMTGKSMEYTGPKLFTNLQIGKIKLFSVGDIKDFDRVYEYKDEDQDINHRLFTKDGKLVGGILFGDIKDMNKLKKAVYENLEIESYLENNPEFK